MRSSWLGAFSSPSGAAWALVLLSPLSAAAGFASGRPLLLPVLAAAPAYVAMILLLRDDRRDQAVGAMLLWALLLGASLTVLCAAMPDRASTTVIHGRAYWEEMRGWVETGEGRESRPREFIPQHLAHAGAFAALSLVSASLLSVVLGAGLMSYMAYYVSRVALATGAHPILAGALAWHPWSLVRVASFVVLGVVLSEPLLSVLRKGRRVSGSTRPWLLIAVAGLALDVVLKALLGPHWPALLRSLR